MMYIGATKVIWGYMCTFIFGFLSILSVRLFVKDSKEKENQ